jgi:hypothetical protein
MSNTSKYLFRFDHLKVEIPYTDYIINIHPPWTYMISIGSCLLYIFLITIIFPLFTSKLSPKFKTSFAKIHHGLLFLYSLFAFMAAMIHIIETKEIINWTDYMCTPVPPWLRAISITFTISKIWEWFDTAILIWKGQSLSKIGFLHTYHHATTLLLFLCVMNLPGAEKSGILLNGFVHTLMYYHFAFRLPRIIRPVITLLQIVQLMASTYIWHITPDYCPRYKHFPKQNFLEFLMPYALVPVYCLFFVKFFIEQYVLSSSNKVKYSSRKEE